MSNDDALLRAGHSLIDSLEAAGAVFDDRGTARNYQSHVVRRLPGSDVNLINETAPHSSNQYAGSLRDSSNFCDRTIQSPVANGFVPWCQIIKDPIESIPGSFAMTQTKVRVFAGSRGSRGP